MFLGEKFHLRASTRWNNRLPLRKRAGSDAYHLRHNTCQTTALAGRATPPHLQNQPDAAFRVSDCMSETADYKGAQQLCQAPEAQWIKYHTPKPAPAISRTSNTASRVITSLNFRYRFLSGGVSE